MPPWCKIGINGYAVKNVLFYVISNWHVLLCTMFHSEIDFEAVWPPKSHLLKRWGLKKSYLRIKIDFVATRHLLCTNYHNKKILQWVKWEWFYANGHTLCTRHKLILSDMLLTYILHPSNPPSIYFVLYKMCSVVRSNTSVKNVMKKWNIMYVAIICLSMHGNSK